MPLPLLAAAAPGMLQAGLGLAGYISDSNRKQELEANIAQQQRDMQARDNAYAQKLTGRYNDDLLKRNLAQSGDFSKSSGLYDVARNQIANQGAIATQNANDNLVKRGLTGTAIGNQQTTNVANAGTSAVANLMGQYANSLDANPNLINSAHGMNNGARIQLGSDMQTNAGLQPSLGGALEGVTNVIGAAQGANVGRQNANYTQRMNERFNSARANPVAPVATTNQAPLLTQNQFTQGFAKIY